MRWPWQKKSKSEAILDALCSIEIPFNTNEAARRGFIMAINEDGTINPEKLKEYYAQKLENDERFWKWQVDSLNAATAAASKR